MKTLFRIFGVLIVLLAVGYIVLLNMPKASVKNETALFDMSAETLYAEFTSNEKKANRQYIGKTIVVRGDIADTEIDEKGSTVLLLETGDDVGAVMCTLEKGEKEKIGVGEVTVKGLCTGFLMDVVLNKCVILNE